MKGLKGLNILVIMALMISAMSTIEASEQSLSPMDVVLKYFEANRNMDWISAAHYISPDSLSKFRLRILSIINRTEEGEQQDLVKEFGVSNLAELESLSPVEFYAANMRRQWSPLKNKQVEYLRSAKGSILDIKNIAKDKIIVKFESNVDFEGKHISKTGEYLLVKKGLDWKIDIMNSGGSNRSIQRK